MINHDISTGRTARRKRKRHRSFNYSPDYRHQSLVARSTKMHKSAMPADIFCRQRRRHIRSRAIASPLETAWLFKRMADDLLERLDFVVRPLQSALIFGDIGSYLRDALTARQITSSIFDVLAKTNPDFGGEEDFLVTGEEKFDLIIACGMLDSVNDLPGSLIQMRRALNSGGLFFAAIPGGGSLPLLRNILSQAISEGGIEARPRMHPQIDLRTAGDLLARAGFHLPVVDQDDVIGRYENLRALIDDIRSQGLSSALPNAVPLARQHWLSLQQGAERHRSDGKIAETFSTLFLTGWAPQADDPVQNGPVKGLFQDRL
jgi:NADH dehydrogenase [ubiquinone] 1 alpha subcomplex assembly factor 5